MDYQTLSMQEAIDNKLPINITECIKHNRLDLIRALKAVPFRPRDINTAIQYEHINLIPDILDIIFSDDHINYAYDKLDIIMQLIISTGDVELLKHLLTKISQDDIKYDYIDMTVELKQYKMTRILIEYVLYLHEHIITMLINDVNEDTTWLLRTCLKSFTNVFTDVRMVLLAKNGRIDLIKDSLNNKTCNSLLMSMMLREAHPDIRDELMLLPTTVYEETLVCL